jgi:hypothetical protein
MGKLPSFDKWVVLACSDEVVCGVLLDDPGYTNAIWTRLLFISTVTRSNFPTYTRLTPSANLSQHTLSKFLISTQLTSIHAPPYSYSAAPLKKSALCGPIYLFQRISQSSPRNSKQLTAPSLFLAQTHPAKHLHRSTSTHDSHFQAHYPGLSPSTTAHVSAPSR